MNWNIEEPNRMHSEMVRMCPRKMEAFTTSDNVNQVGVKVPGRNSRDGDTVILVDLPCGLSTEKTYGPAYTHYTYSAVGQSSLRFVHKQTKYKWEGDPENDHVEEVYMTASGHLVVVLYQAGFKKCEDFPHPDATWIPRGEPWIIFADELGRICLKYKDRMPDEVPEYREALEML